MCKPLWFLSFFAVAFNPPAHADDAQPCDSGTIEAAARWAGVKGKLVSRDEQGGLIVAAACKAMPNAPGTTIAAIAFDTNHEVQSPDETTSKMQVIALVEAGKVVAADRSTIIEDAATVVGSNTYRIDTARYILSKDVRAFGVVFTSYAGSHRCHDAGTEADLTLWVREGKRLRAIFGTNLSGWNTIKGWTCGPQEDDLQIEHARMTIAVEKTSSHGFADLSITAHVTKDDLDTGKRTVRKVLKYDGQSYGINMFRRFWYPEECVTCPGLD